MRIRHGFGLPERLPIPGRHGSLTTATATVAALLTAILASLVLAGTTHAATASYYVDCTAGADSNTGTSPTSAWRSLSPVSGRTFAAGNVISLKRGCTWDGGLVARSSGSAGNPITYTAYGTGAAPTIRNTTGGTYAKSVDVTGDYNVIDGLLVRDAREAGVTLRAGADRNIVRNVEATAVGLGIVSSGQYNLLTRNSVHDLKMIVNTPGGDDDYGAVCFWIAGANNEVSYNRGTNCRAPSSDYGMDGGFVEVWKQGDSTSVHHNQAENTNGFFEIGGSGSARNMTVAHNVLINVHGGLCLHNGGSFTIAFDNFRFEHNTYYSSSDGYRFLDCVTGLTPSMVIMRNNVFHSNMRIASSGNFTHSNNLYHMTGGATVGYALGSGERTADPRFANVAGRDLRLQSGSPAIDTGAKLGYTTDFDDLLREVGSAPDLGAFESQSGSTTTSGGTSGSPTSDIPASGSSTSGGSTPVGSTTPTVMSINDNSIGTSLNQVSYSGTWSYAKGTGKFLGDDHYTATAGSAYTVRFSGTQVRLYVATAPWHGKAAVSIDGGPETTIDLYAAGKADQVLGYTSPALAAGTHTLKVRALGTRNSASTGTYVTADRVDVVS